jgi:hypothetical protein
MSRTAMFTIGTLGLLCFFCSSGRAAAQVAASASCGSDGGTIRGVVVNDSTGVPVPASYIYLFLRGSCRATADALGRFVVHDVPAGTQRIETGSSGYRQFRPVNVQVIAGDTTHIELRLVPGGPLQDCRASPSCSAMTDGGSGSIRDEDAAFRLVALGTAIGLAWSTVGSDDRWYACLEDEQAPVFLALGERYGPVVGGEECQLPRDSTGRPARQLRHTGTNHPAFRPRVDRVVEVVPGRRTVSLSYYVGPLWGAGWDCDFERTERGWRASLCIAVWVS